MSSWSLQVRVVANLVSVDIRSATGFFFDIMMEFEEYIDVKEMYQLMTRLKNIFSIDLIIEPFCKPDTPTIQNEGIFSSLNY